MGEMFEDVVIVGAGIAGLAAALALRKVGVRSLVLERHHELRNTGTSITLAPNAWRALDALGVADKLASLYNPFCTGSFTEVATGETRLVTYGSPEEIDRTGYGARAVHRRVLLETLAEGLPPDMIRFSAKIVTIEMEKTHDSTIALVHLENGAVIKAKALIGCDGLHSMVAQWLGLSPPVHSGRSAVRGLSVFPEGHGYKNEVQQFLSDGSRAGFIPLSSTELFWFITCRSVESSRDPILIKKEVMENRAKDFPRKFLDVVEHSNLDSLTLDHLRLRVPWNLLFGALSKGNVTVAGDAMHPMTPDLGQGGCQALEDAVILGRKIGELRRADGKVEWDRVGAALEAYVKERRWRSAGVIAGAYFLGWAQEGGAAWLGKFPWLKNFLRDKIFFKYVYKRVIGIVDYDCGKLPVIH